MQFLVFSFQLICHFAVSFISTNQKENNTLFSELVDHYSTMRRVGI